MTGIQSTQEFNLRKFRFTVTASKVLSFFFHSEMHVTNVMFETAGTAVVKSALLHRVKCLQWLTLNANMG